MEFFWHRPLRPDGGRCRLGFLCLLVGFALSDGPRIQAAVTNAPLKPNILILMADDLGYWDIGAQGCTDIPTPHIDSIATNGIRFTDGYVTSPQCSPSRAGMLTGRSQSRFGHEINWEPSAVNADCGLPLTEKTIADHLRVAGYRTAAIGKWHLGESAKFYPNQRGFDEFFGFRTGGHNYFCDQFTNSTAVSWVNRFLERNGRPEASTGYLTTVLANESAAFIERNKNQPWLLYVAFNAPHTPMQATEELLARFPTITNSERKTYAAMVSGLDDAVGTILNQLRTSGIEERTLVFFLSDNGGPLAGVNGSRNDPLRGKKGEVWEGGMRVPFLAQWKGVLPSGQTYTNPVSSLDILPTALASAGQASIASAPLDGVNLIPYLTGASNGIPHETLFWRMLTRNIWAVRSGNHKLLLQDTNVPRLYDIAADISETNDRSASEAAVRDALQQQYNQWETTLPAPLWEVDGIADGPLTIDWTNSAAAVLGTNFTLNISIDNQGTYHLLSTSTNVPSTVSFNVSGLTTLPNMAGKTFALQFSSPNGYAFELNSNNVSGRIGMSGLVTGNNKWRFDATNEVARISADLRNLPANRGLQMQSFLAVNSVTNWVIGLRDSAGNETLSATNATNLVSIAPRLGTGQVDFFDFRAASGGCGGWGKLVFDFVLSPPYTGSVIPAPLFSSGCVLQRDMPVPVWGTAAPNDTNITVSVRNQTKTAVADATGKWRVTLDPEPAGGPVTMQISGSQSVPTQLTDVYFGDVWYLAGDAAMARSLRAEVATFPGRYPALPDATDNFDELRFALLAPAAAPDAPLTEPALLQPWGRWQADRLGDFPATGYFFARALREALHAAGQTNVPLGFLHAAKDNSAVEDWIPKAKLDTARSNNPSLQLSASASDYYNGMLAPVQSYAAKGVLWIDAEGDLPSSARIQQYPALKQMLIEAWREQASQSGLLFLSAQATAFGAFARVPGDEAWAWMREAQTSSLALADTAVACLIDRGQQWDGNPPGKDQIGQRLAKIALARAYSLPGAARGPTLQDVTVQDDEVTVTFSNVAAGLETRAVDAEPDSEETQNRLLPGTTTLTNFPAVSISADKLGGFALAGNDGVFHWATEARIISTNQVRLANRADVPAPVHVRYAWQNYPRCNLYNSEGLPAEPFRTDTLAYGSAGGANSTPVTSGLTNRTAESGQTSVPVSLAGVFDDVEDGAAPLSLSLSQNSNPGVVTAALSGTSLQLSFPGPAGTSQLTVQATDSGGKSSSASFLLTVEAVTYLGWQKANFTAAERADPAAEASLWGDQADPDGDQLPNLLEYALAANPRQANSATPSLQILQENGVLKLRYLRAKQLDRDPSISMGPEKRGSLGPSGSWSSLTNAETTAPATADADWREVTLAPAPGTTGEFYRVTIRRQ